MREYSSIGDQGHECGFIDTYTQAKQRLIPSALAASRRLLSWRGVHYPDFRVRVLLGQQKTECERKQRRRDGLEYEFPFIFSKYLLMVKW